MQHKRLSEVGVGWRRECGARELKRTIKRHVETPLTDLMLERTIREGMSVKVRVKQHALVFETEGRLLERAPVPAPEPVRETEEDEVPAG